MDVLTFKLPAVLHRDQRRGGGRGRWPGQGPPARRVAAEAGRGGRGAGPRVGGVQAAAPGGGAGGGAAERRGAGPEAAAGRDIRS